VKFRAVGEIVFQQITPISIKVVSKSPTRTEITAGDYQ
jgi:hypothetical protein